MAEAYKQLTWIERLWRELKDIVKDNVMGHIFACFLALYLVALAMRAVPTGR